MFIVLLDSGAIIKCLAAGRNGRFHHSIRVVAGAVLLDMILGGAPSRLASLVNIGVSATKKMDIRAWQRKSV